MKKISPTHKSYVSYRAISFYKESQRDDYSWTVWTSVASKGSARSKIIYLRKMGTPAAMFLPNQHGLNSYNRQSSQNHSCKVFENPATGYASALMSQSHKKKILKLKQTVNFWHFAKSVKRWEILSWTTMLHLVRIHAYPHVTPTSLHHFIYRIRPNYRTVHLGFSKLLGTLSCGRIWIYLLMVHYKKSE